MDVYDRIRFLLKQKHQNRHDLAEGTGISYNTITAMIQRRSENVSYDTMKKFANFLGVSIDYLILGLDNSANDHLDDAVVETDFSNMDLEIMRIARRLNMKLKTQLLAYAYGLEEKLKEVAKHE